MIAKIKRKLGYLKRGVLGYIQNSCEKTPQASGEPFSIGRSVQKRSIDCYKVGDGPCKVLYVFGIHGNETGTVKLGKYFLNWAENNSDELKNFSLFIVPCLNPDGFALAQKNPDYLNGGKIGRFNANNVDLNRNFDTKSFTQKSTWSTGKNYSEKTEVFCGDHGFSEPETKALSEFIKKEKIKILFTFHNAGKQVMGNKNDLSQKLVKTYCKMANFYYVSEKEWHSLNQTGMAKEWCDEHDIAFVEVEGSNRWGSDWQVQKAALEASLKVIK